MSSIDKRIVELVLNNGQFEKNAKTSISTLDRLKSALNFSGSGASFDEIERKIKKVNFEPITSALDTINYRFSTFGVAGAAAIERITNAAIDCGKKLVSVLQKPLDQIMTGGWARSSNIAQAKFLIEGLGKDWEKLSEDINYAVKDTAFGFDEAARVVAQFSATGVEAGDTMKAYARAVSGVAAMTNSSYSEIGHIFTTISGQGKILGEQMNQFAVRGLNVAHDLAKAYNVSEEELRKMVSDGKVSFHDFAMTMDKLYGTHAKKANETFVGSLANMRAALSRIGAKFATPIQDVSVRVFNTVRKLIDGVSERLDKAKIYSEFAAFAEEASMFVKNVINKIDLSKIDFFLTNIADGLSKIRKLMRNLFPNTWGLDLGDSLAAGSEALDDSLEELANAVIRGEYGNGQERIDKLADMYEKVQNKVNEIMGNSFRYAEANEAVAESLDKVRESTSLTEEEVNELAEAVIRGDYGNGQERLEKLGENYWVVQNRVNELKDCTVRYNSANERVTDGMIEVVYASDEAAESTEGYTKGVINLYNALGYLKERMFEVLKGFGTPENAEKLKDIAKGLSSVFNILTNVLAAFIKGAADPLAKIVEVVGNTFLTAGSNIGKWITEFDDFLNESGAYEKIEKGTGKVLNFILGIVQSISDFIVKITEGENPLTKFFGNQENIDNLSNGFEGLLALFNIIKNLIGTVINSAKGPLSKILHSLGSIFLDAVGDIGGGLVDLDKAFTENGIYETLGSGLSTILETIAGAIGKIADAIHGINIDQPALSKFFDVFTGTEKSENIETVGDAIGYFIGVINGVAKTIAGYLLGDAVDGVNGLASALSAVLPTLSKLWPVALEVVKGILLFNGTKALNSFFKTIQAAPKLLNSFARETNSKALLNVAFAIGVVAGALFLLSHLSWQQLEVGAVALMAITGALAALFTVIGVLTAGTEGGPLTKLVTTIGNSFANKNNASAILKLAIAFGVLAGSMFLLGHLSWDQFNVAAASIILITGALSALLVVYNAAQKLKPAGDKGGILDSIGNAITNIGNSVAKTIKKIGMSALIASLAAFVFAIAFAVKSLSSISLDDGLKAVALIGLLFGELAITLAIIKAVCKNTSDTAGVATLLLALTVAVKGLSRVIENLSKIPMQQGLKAITFLGLVFAELLITIGIMQRFTKQGNTLKIAVLLLSITMVVKQLAPVIKELSEIPLPKGIKAVVLLGILFAEILGVLAIGSKLTGVEKSFSSAVFMISFGVLIRMMSTAIKELSAIKPSDIGKATRALYSISAIAAGILYVGSKTSGSLSNLTTMLSLAGILTAFTASLVALSKIDKDRLKSSTDALKQVMLMITMFNFTSALGGNKSLESVAPEILSTIAILAGIVLAFKTLEGMDGDKMHDISQSISSLFKAIGVFSALFGAGTSDIKFGSFEKKSMTDVKAILSEFIGIGVLLAEVAGILYLMKDIDPANMAVVSDSLAGVMVALGVLSAGVGNLGGTSGNLKSDFFTGLSQVITTGELFALVVGIEAVAGFVMEHFPGFKDLVDKGLPLLTSIGQGIGAFIGGIVTGAFTPIAGMLTNFTGELSDFIYSLSDFFGVIGGVDENALDVSKLETIKSVFDSLVSIAWDDLKVSFIEGINNLFKDSNGKSPIEGQIEGLKTFVQNVGSLQEEIVKNIGDSDPTEKIDMLATILGSLAAAGLADLVASFVAGLANIANEELKFNEQTGELEVATKDGPSSLQKLMDNLAAFIEAYATFAPSLEKLPDPKDNSDKLSNLAMTLGLLSVIGVETFLTAIAGLNANDITVAAIKNELDKLGSFIDAFALFQPKLELLSGTDVEEKLTRLKTTLDLLGSIGWSTLKDTLINGLIDFFSADTVFDPASGAYTTSTSAEDTMVTKLKDLEAFVDAFATFEKDHLSQLSDDDGTIDKLDTLTDIIEKFDNVTPKSGGFFEDLFGEKDLSKFGENLVTFGSKFVEYNNIVSGTDFSKALSVTDDLVAFADAMNGLTSDGGLFSTTVASQGIDSFGTIVSGWFVSISTAIDNNSSTLTDLGGTIFRYILSGLETAKDEKKSSKALKEAVKAAVEAIRDKIKESLEEHEDDSKTDSVKAKILEVIKGICDKVVNKAADFKEVGKAMMMGIKAGIEEGKAEAINAAAAAGSESVQATRDAVGMNSPAKKFIEIAMYSMKGLAVGFTKYAPVATDAVGRVAGMAVKSMNDGLSEVSTSAEESSYNLFESLQGVYGYINDLINGTIDTQPKIVPVMDLSNIQNGTNLLGRMLSGTDGYSLNLGGMNLSAVVDSLNTKSSENQMIVDAIYELRSDVNTLSDAMSNMGVTLEDGTLVGKLAPKMSARMRLLASGSR